MSTDGVSKSPPPRKTASSPSMRGRSSNALSGAALTKEEQSAVLADLQKRDDETGKKTMSRIFVEKYLSKYNWYWPRRNEKGAPQLSKAWMYYEHNTLPRHITGENDAEHVYRMAERGEHEEDTELYPHVCLTQSALIEWGAGMDLYFISLWFFAMIMLVAGCINIFSIVYFSGTEYNGDSESSLATWLQGSAICTNTEWVVCSTCPASDWDESPNNAPDRYATALDTNNLTTILVKRNQCSFDEFGLGWPNLATLAFLLVAVGIFNMYLRAREVRFDEDKVTTSDYTVLVSNPPKDAKDPDEWRDFFQKFASDGDQVTGVAIALNNEDLVNKLATRRVYRNHLRLKLSDGVDLDNDEAVMLAIDKYNQELAEQPVGCIGCILNCIAPIFKLVGMMLTADELYEQIRKLTEQIKELQEKEYHAIRVFVTFETENGQRTALSALNVGKAELKSNRLGARPPDCHFRGELLLDVEEPAEPSAIRYMELSHSTVSRLIRRAITLTITCCLIGFASWSVFRVRETSGPWLSGPLTTIFNSSMPMVLKLLLLVEKHGDEGSYQRSVYLKLTLFRWTLSGVLTAFITPFTRTLGDESSDMIPTISALLVSEVWLSPLMRLSDYTSNLKKHVLAPRAKSQEEMNSWFNGSWFQLGERYTDFTKILFVVFFYSAVFPAGFFFGFVILATQYYMDKFCLVRIWQPTPRLGADLANFSRRFFFTATLVAFAMVSSLTWAQYPYDQLCEDDERADEVTTGFFKNVTDLNGDMVDGGVIDVSANRYFVSCNQNWRSWAGLPWPATARVQTGEPGWLASVDGDDLQWMSDSQTVFTRVYGGTAVAVFLVCIFGLFANALYKTFLSFFKGVYEPEGEPQEIDFSSNVEIFAYVPEVKRSGQPSPFLCCDVDDFDESMIGWSDSNPYDYSNLIFDVPHNSLRRQQFAVSDENVAFDDQAMFGFHRSRYPGVVRKKLDYENSIYSLVKHYPTKWQLKMAKQDGLQFDD